MENEEKYKAIRGEIFEENSSSEGSDDEEEEEDEDEDEDCKYLDTQFIQFCH